MAKIGLWISLFVLFVLAIVFGFQKPIGSWLYQIGVEQQASTNSAGSIGDGLHLGLCGTGSPLPNLDRAGPCNFILAGGQLFIVDIGQGGSRNLSLMGVNAGNVEGLFLTHFHSDHVDGMGPLMLMHWVGESNTSPLRVYGPSGVEKVVAGFNAAYAMDATYRTAHHGERIAPSSGFGAEAHPFSMDDETSVVFDQGGLKVTAFTVPHSPVEPAVGYRFDYKGRSVCISGDTEKSVNLERACSGADLIVHEALQPAMVTQIQDQLELMGNERGAKIMLDIKDYHASPEDAAKSAQAAGADMLVLSHLVPPLPNSYFYPAFLGDAKNYFKGEIIVGEDGMLFSLKPDSDIIERSKLM